jgi:hypothetical protein
MKKWANELSRAFSKEEVQMAKNHMKKYSIFLAIKEMKIKTTLKFHLTLVRMAIVKNTYTHTHTHTHTHRSAGKDVGTKDLVHSFGNVN